MYRVHPLVRLSIKATKLGFTISSPPYQSGDIASTVIGYETIGQLATNLGASLQWNLRVFWWRRFVGLIVGWSRELSGGYSMSTWGWRSEVESTMRYMSPLGPVCVGLVDLAEHCKIFGDLEIHHIIVIGWLGLRLGSILLNLLGWTTRRSHFEWYDFV